MRAFEGNDGEQLSGSMSGGNGSISSANSQISWGGGNFYGVGKKFFFAPSCRKPRISTPY